MATPLQLLANKKNALKSTGAKTPEGKAKIAMNAVKHGILSNRLILPLESKKEFDGLLNSLIDSFKPVGSYEQLLVEKIAVVLWKQKRLVEAETAKFLLDDSSIKLSMGVFSWIKGEDAFLEIKEEGTTKKEATKEEIHLMELQEELSQITSEHSLEDISIQYKLAFKELQEDATSHSEKEANEISFEDIEEYLGIEFNGSLEEWKDHTMKWIAERKRELFTIISLYDKYCLASKMSASPFRPSPINDSLSRYQTSLDNQLIKMSAELRRQQEFRLKNFMLDM